MRSSVRSRPAPLRNRLLIGRFFFALIQGRHEVVGLLIQSLIQIGGGRRFFSVAGVRYERFERVELRGDF